MFRVYDIGRRGVLCPVATTPPTYRGALTPPVHRSARSMNASPPRFHRSGLSVNKSPCAPKHKAIKPFREPPTAPALSPIGPFHAQMAFARPSLFTNRPNPCTLHRPLFTNRPIPCTTRPSTPFINRPDSSVRWRTLLFLHRSAHPMH